ncbi:hypothetical protein ACFLIN_03870 [Corynebacterium kutscheri]|uniref:hypothetical protein n=1 Tax=Corynebacterium kutscheri TaxID=35755 RepID=UPI0037C0DB64
MTPTPLPRELRKIALAQLEGMVSDWTHDYGQHFLTQQDIIHSLLVSIDIEKENLQ